MGNLFEDDMGNLVDLSEVISMEWTGDQPIVTEGLFACYRLQLRKGGATEVKMREPSRLKKALMRG